MGRGGRGLGVGSRFVQRVSLTSLFLDGRPSRLIRRPGEQQIEVRSRRLCPYSASKTRKSKTKKPMLRQRILKPRRDRSFGCLSFTTQGRRLDPQARGAPTL